MRVLVAVDHWPGMYVIQVGLLHMLQCNGML